MTDADRAFLFLVHRRHGLLLLYTTRKKSKGPHYQVPGGHVEDEDFDVAAKTNLKNGKDDPILAYKSCAARELYEETGIDLRGSLDRLEPLQLKEPKGKLPCEYKQRIFFSAEIFDHDIALQDEMVALTSSLTQALDKSPPDAMLKLSEEHQGFMFERNLSKAVELLTLHSGGKVSNALNMAIESGEVEKLIGDTTENEYDMKGEQVQLPIECNKVIKHEMDISPCKETNPSDCHRSFNLYFPQIVCESGDDLSEIGTLPLVFVIHCYGCNSQVMMDSFSPYANSHNAVIVAPDGLQNSFNGLDCCGYALSSKIDDVGFFAQIQTTVESEYSFVKSKYSYGVGWSNGGYMVMTAAKLFRAIAPISGYIIDYSDLRGGTSVFFHHSLDDPFVNATGCCSDPDMPACCCGIFADRCVSVQEVMVDIAKRKNGCDYEVGSVQLEQSFADAAKGISCMTATSASCNANNTICLYSHSGHFNSGSFASSFPMREQVLDFFATDLCNTNNGVWSANECRCEENSGFGGMFCLDHISASSSSVVGSSKTNEGEAVSANHTVSGGILALTVAALCIIKSRLGRGKLKDKDEQDSESEKIELVESDARGLVNM